MIEALWVLFWLDEVLLTHPFTICIAVFESMTIITSEFHIYRLVENVRIYIVCTVKINSMDSPKILTSVTCGINRMHSCIQGDNWEIGVALLCKSYSPSSVISFTCFTLGVRG